MILTQSVVEDVASHHKRPCIRILAYVCEILRRRLCVAHLEELSHEVLNLQLDLLGWFDFPVVVQIQSNHVVHVDGSSPVNEARNSLIIAKAFLFLLAILVLIWGQSL